MYRRSHDRRPAVVAILLSVGNALIAALALFLIVFGGAPDTARAAYENLLASGTQCPNQQSRSASVADQEKAMRCLINYARKQRGIGQLNSAPKLADSAGRKAKDIESCSFSHTACGRSIDHWIQYYGYLNCGSYLWGENIAWGSGTAGDARSIMLAWLNSDGHRANILNSRFKDQGVGLAKAGDRQYWVNHFGWTGC